MDRRALHRQGMLAAAECRDQLDLDPFGPVDPYAIAEALGVKVVFLDTSMEGFYFKQPTPRVLLSSLRPVPRRAFTCAHELGHHWFGHGSTIDQLKEDDRGDSDKPDEILANAFAGALLMPTVGLRGAFARRGWVQANPTPLQLFTIACQFGVGYDTLLSHMSYVLREISSGRRAELDRWGPQRIRRELLKEDYDALLIVDSDNEAATFDVETGTAVLLPLGVTLSGNALDHVRTTEGFEIYEAVRRGVAEVSGLAEPFQIRVMPAEVDGTKGYVGAAANRFEEDPDEE
jgi:Zn-dependent peptidase ImmA (M78 family)